MALANVTIKGNEKLDKFFSKFNSANEIYRKLDKSFKLSAEIMQNAMKFNTPAESGDLKDSIEIRKIRFSHYAIGSKSEYAVPVEYGRSYYGSTRTKHNYDATPMKPQFNFTNAFTENKKKIVNTVRDALKEAVK